MSLFDVDAPGIGPVPRGYFKDVLQSTAPSLSKKQSGKLSDLFGKLLSSGADSNRVAFEAATLGQQYPGESAFQPGGSVFNRILEERLSPQSKKETIADANYLAQTVLNRPMTPEEEKYVKKTRDLDAFAGLLYSSPEAALKDSPTDYENKLAYYGRLVPGPEGYTGKRFSNITPVEYTGGIS